MKRSSSPSWLDVIFIGPNLVWQTVKMTIASVRVITHRSRILAAGPKNSAELREYPRMVQEKFAGGREAALASMQSLPKAGPAMMGMVFTKWLDLIKASRTLVSARDAAAQPKLTAQFLRSVVALMLVIPTQIYVFLAAIIFSAAAPLDKRVTANAKRLKSSGRKSR